MIFLELLAAALIAGGGLLLVVGLSAILVAHSGIDVLS